MFKGEKLLKLEIRAMRYSDELQDSAKSDDTVLMTPETMEDESYCSTGVTSSSREVEMYVKDITGFRNSLPIKFIPIQRPKSKRTSLPSTKSDIGSRKITLQPRVSSLKLDTTEVYYNSQK